MPTEILNIEYHQRRMTLKALNKAATLKEAADLLGVNRRTILRWKKEFGIILNEKAQQYEFKQKAIIIFTGHTVTFK